MCPKCKKSAFVDLSEEAGGWAIAAHPTLKVERVPEGFTVAEEHPVPQFECSSCGVRAPFG
jgi:hypothetical protein